MAYNNFTLESVRTAFELQTIGSIDLFSGIEPVTPRSHFTEELRKKIPLAVAIGTEKARSELIVANVLFELREHFDRRISLFSGIDFSTLITRKKTVYLLFMGLARQEQNGNSSN